MRAPPMVGWSVSARFAFVGASMSVQRKHEATDCDLRSTDWTTIGARILQVAAMASAIHMAERAKARHSPWAVATAGELNHRADGSDARRDDSRDG